MQDAPIICGWYTPDYKHWLDRLLPSVNALGLEHDFILSRSREIPWEEATLQKPSFALALMRRHPDRTLLLVDVDCIVTGSLWDILRLCAINADIGVYLRTKWTRTGAVRAHPRSGTLVIQPTPKAKEFLENWEAEGDAAPSYQIDEASLMVALGKTPSLTISVLPVEAVATPKDYCANPIIFHGYGRGTGSEGKHTPKWRQYISGRPIWRRWFSREM